MIEGIKPHGGRLVNRWTVGDEALALAELAPTLRQLRLDPRRAAELELLAVGAYSPLEGFMGRADYLGVIEELRLANGLAWPLPVTLPVPAEDAKGLRDGETVAPIDDDGLPLGLLEVTESYRYNKESEAFAIFGTTDDRHTGVTALYRQGEMLVAGPVRLFRRPRHAAFAHYRFDPLELRQTFATKRWQTIACWPLNRPLFRASEYLQKCVLETVDGLLVQAPLDPIDEPSAGVRIGATETLLRHYYPEHRVVLAVAPASPRWAGPRETLLQAIVSQNYGCTHFLVDPLGNAGTGGNPNVRRPGHVSPPLEDGRWNGRRRGASAGRHGSQQWPEPTATLFARFARGELGITPVFLAPAFYCRACAGMATAKSCPHDADQHVPCPEGDWETALKVSRWPAECVRPEVAQALLGRVGR
jgi:sulfate adenylyltransferase